MKPPRKLIKVAAVGCSALLVAGFISFRAGAVDPYLRPKAATGEPTPVPSAEPEPAAPDAVFYGSKSLILAPATPGGSTAGVTSPAILPGSKSAPVIEIPGSKSESPSQSSQPK
jgi:hypothetical protein